MNIKQKLVGALAALSLLGTVAGASAQQGQPYYGYGVGPGMMGGWCPGCMMGPGMMGGRSMAPGMMLGDWDDWGDRYMGRAMMEGYSYWPALNLTEQQQAKIAQIQEDFRKRKWDLAAKMDAEQAKLNEIYYSGKRDPVVIDNQYKKIFDLRRQMVQESVEAQNRIDAVLTEEQKERSRGYGPGRMMR